MRIISGKYKGLKLNLPKNKNIRPTLDKLKEAVFSMIDSNKYSDNLNGKLFLDLFAGSGALGLEAFSRNASKVYLIEIKEEALNLINSNIKKLNLSDKEKKNIILLKCDVMNLQNIDFPYFDFIYIDPPYEQKNFYDLLNHLIENKIVNNRSLIFIETNEQLKNLHRQFTTLVTKKFGKTYIILLKLIG